MATSGSKSVAVTSYDTLKFSWSLSSQSTTNNTSTVAWKMQLISDSSGRISSTASKTWSVTVDGNSYSGTNTVGISASSTLTLASGTTIIKHDSDGAKTFSYSFSQQFAITVSGSYIGTISGSGTGTLTTIAQASTITSASAVTLGNATSIKFTPKSSSFYYKIKFTLGSGSATTSAIHPNQTTAYTYSYTMSLSTWAKYIPKATSGTCTAVLYTYSDSACSTRIGSTSSKTFTVTVPNTVVPSVSISITPETDFISGLYLTGYSRPVVTITSAVDSYSTGYATISSTNTTFNGTSLTNSESATFTAPTSAGTYTITTTVTDSRGRTANTSAEITFIEYTSPTLSNVSFYRASDTIGTANSSDSGIYGYLAFDYSVSSVNSNNTVVVIAQYKSNSDSTYTTLYSNTSDYSGSVSGYFEASTVEKYTVIISLSDAVTSITTTKTISTVFALIDMKEGSGSVGLGKIVSLNEALQVGLWSYFDYPMFIGYDKTGATDGIAGFQLHTDGFMEITSDTTPYIDFHVANDTEDYTARIISETQALGLLYGENSLYVFNDHISINKYLLLPNAISIRGENADGSATEIITNVSSGNNVVISSANNTGRTNIYAGTNVNLIPNTCTYIYPYTSYSTSNTGYVFRVSTTTSYSADTTSNENIVLACGCDTTSPFLRSYATYARTGSSAANVNITSAGTFNRYSSSSYRYKNTINYFTNEDYASDEALTKAKNTIDYEIFENDMRSVLNLPIVEFHYNDGYMTGEPNYDYSKYEIGFIAEDVYKNVPDATQYNEDGTIEMWNIYKIVPRMLFVLQEHDKDLINLENEVLALKERISVLEETIEKLNGN